jgi:hypothetical protein
VEIIEVYRGVPIVSRNTVEGRPGYDIPFPDNKRKYGFYDLDFLKKQIDLYHSYCLIRMKRLGKWV